MAKQVSIIPEGDKVPESNDCFIIMPISDPEGYRAGHFQKVYEDIHAVACRSAGFNPVRGDDVKQTNLIHLDILQKLIHSPMAICDLSDRNPNVLFELGLRQAFDMPTVLVQEFGTPKIFDIAPFRITEYRRELFYREVLEDQVTITKALTATKDATEKGHGINSIVRLLSLTSPAKITEKSGDDSSEMLRILMSQVEAIRNDVQQKVQPKQSFIEFSEERSSMVLDKLNTDFNILLMHISNDDPSRVILDKYNSLIMMISRAQAEYTDTSSRIKLVDLRKEAMERMQAYMTSKSFS